MAGLKTSTIYRAEPQAPQTSVQTPETPQSSQQTLRSWADGYGVSVDWNPATNVVTLTAPNKTTVSFVTNNGGGYGIGSLNADNYHVIENEQTLLKALNMLPSATAKAPAAAVSSSPDYTYTGTPSANYQLDREAEVLKLKREQTVSNLNAKKSGLESAYGRKRSQLYNQYMDSGMAQSELLAAKGLTGGYSDAADTRREVSYKDVLENLDYMESDDLKAVDGAISEAYQSSADALYSLETGYVAQLLKAAQNLESFDYASGLANAASIAQNILYR